MVYIIILGLQRLETLPLSCGQGLPISWTHIFTRDPRPGPTHISQLGGHGCVASNHSNIVKTTLNMSKIRMLTCIFFPSIEANSILGN